MQNFQLSFKPFGENAILIEWPARIDKEILHNRVAFEKLLREEAAKQLNNQIIDIIPAYHSLTIVFFEPVKNFRIKVDFLQTLYSDIQHKPDAPSKLFHVPVCYAKDQAPDLYELSQKKNLSTEKIIELHTQVVYDIYFIGFLPGFLYLGGLNEKLYTARKDKPSLSVAKGSVAIGGQQTGIYPQDSPGGWYVIGNTPINFFEPVSATPCFAYANDQLKFFPVSRDEYHVIQQQLAEGCYQIQSETIHA